MLRCLVFIVVILATGCGSGKAVQQLTGQQVANSIISPIVTSQPIPGVRAVPGAQSYARVTVNDGRVTATEVYEGWTRAGDDNPPRIQAIPRTGQRYGSPRRCPTIRQSAIWCR